MQSEDTRQDSDDGENASLEWEIRKSASYCIKHYCEGAYGKSCITMEDTYWLRKKETWSTGAYCDTCKKIVPKSVLFQLKLLRGW